MHCLPVRRNVVVADARARRAAQRGGARRRATGMWAQMAVLHRLLGGDVAAAHPRHAKRRSEVAS